MNKIELEERLIDFAVLIYGISGDLRHTELGRTLLNQMVRSGSSAALNYGEAQGAESQRDFIHRLRISLKELREPYVALRITSKANLIKDIDQLKSALCENNQLISILVASIRTAEKKLHS